MNTLDVISARHGADYITAEGLILIEVKNRKLEQFYYLHGVDFVSCRKDYEDGLTVWEYEDNEENRHILEEFRTAIKRREAKRNGVT